MSGRRFSLQGRTSTSQLRVEPMPAAGRVRRRAYGAHVKARTPAGLGWLSLGEVPGGDGAHAWIHVSATQVLSSLDIAKLPRSGVLGPQWHVSVADRTTEEPLRASANQIALARCAFGMLEAEEDNHHPGNARHFWMPVDPNERVDCECKADEVLVQDPDGYQWTNAVEGECRGCEHERTMRDIGLARPCPLHTQSGEERVP